MKVRVLRCPCGKAHCCAGITATTMCACGRRLYPLVWTAGR